MILTGEIINGKTKNFTDSYPEDVESTLDKGFNSLNWQGSIKDEFKNLKENFFIA